MGQKIFFFFNVLILYIKGIKRNTDSLLKFNTAENIPEYEMGFL